MKQKPVHTIIDGKNLTARHFAAMSEEVAVKAMIADGITTDEAWAKKAHALCIKDVKEADKPAEKPAEKKV